MRTLVGEGIGAADQETEKKKEVCGAYSRKKEKG